MSKEISTYFGYTNGYDSGVLRLGNKSLDYVNPRMREPYIHEEIRLRNLLSSRVHGFALTLKTVPRTSRDRPLPAEKKIAI